MKYSSALMFGLIFGLSFGVYKNYEKINIIKLLDPIKQLK